MSAVANQAFIDVNRRYVENSVGSLGLKIEHVDYAMSLGMYLRPGSGADQPTPPDDLQKLPLGAQQLLGAIVQNVRDGW